MNEFDIILLKQFIKKDIEYTSTTLCNALQIEDINIVEKSLSELLELGYIKIAHKDIIYTSYQLTPLGRDYFKNISKNNFSKYWFPIITSLVTFVLNLIISLLLKFL